MHCVECGAEFQTTDKRLRYCSDDCRKETNRRRAREYSQANPERNREKVKRWRENNPEKRAEQMARWQAKNPDYNRENARRWYHANKDRARAARILRQYGLTIADYDAMLEAQGGGCAICGAVEVEGDRTSFHHVDHCHASGKVRGVLCRHCNNGLGHFRDDPSLLRAAAKYLERP